MLTRIRVLVFALLTGLPSVSNAEQVLSFEDAVEKAVKQSSKLGIAQEAVSAQSAKQWASIGKLGPSVGITGDYGHNQQPAMINFDGMTLNEAALLVNNDLLTLVQPITGLVAGALAIHADGTTRKVLQLDADDAAQEAAFGMASLYRKVQMEKALVEIAKSAVQAKERQYKDGSKQFELGIRTKADVMRLAVALSQAKSTLAKQETELYASMLQIKTALKMDLADFCVLGDLSQPSSIQLPPDDKLDLSEPGIFKRRHSLARIAYQKEQLNNKRSGHVLSLFPSLNFTAKWTRDFAPTSLPDPLPFQSYWGFHLDWPIFSMGSQLAEIGGVNAELRGAQIQYDAEKRQIQQEVQTHLANYKLAYEVWTLISPAVAEAKEAFRIETLRFEKGLNSVTDMLLAESAYRQVQGETVRAMVDLDKSYFELQRVLGQPRPISLL